MLMRIFRIVLLVLLLALFTALVMQNTEVVAVQLLSFQVEMSLIVLLLITMVLSFLAGYITAKLPAYQQQRKAKKVAKQQEKERKRHEKEAKRAQKKGGELPPAAPPEAAVLAVPPPTADAEPVAKSAQPTNK